MRPLLYRPLLVRSGLALLTLSSACAREVPSPPATEGRYQLDVPPSPPLPALRLHLATMPSPEVELPASTITALLNPVYLAVRHCAETSGETVQSGTLQIVFDAAPASTVQFLGFENNALFPEPLVECLRGQITARPSHPTVGEEYSIAVMVEIP